MELVGHGHYDPQDKQDHLVKFYFVFLLRNILKNFCLLSDLALLEQGKTKTNYHKNMDVW